MRAFDYAGFSGSLVFAVLGMLTPITGYHAVGQTIVENNLMKAPEEGGARRLEVTGNGLQSYLSPSKSSKAVQDFATGAILANLGCSKVAERIWCEVKHFRGGARGFADAEHLKPAIGPDGVVPTGVNDTRQRARKRDFDADGEILCSQEQGQSLGKCTAQVARSSGADATVGVKFPNGFARSLYFIHGEFVSASATMSGAGRDTDWRHKGGIYFIRVDDQRYEITAEFIFGNNRATD